jgi:hypothetical protein
MQSPLPAYLSAVDQTSIDASAHDAKPSPPASCFGERTCTRAGWLLFFRALQCPCGRPRNPKLPKNASSLRTVTLQLPVAAADKYARPDNTVVTSKYTVWDFLPRATSLQFRRAINVYYLVQVILLLIGWVLPVSGGRALPVSGGR